MLMPFLLLLVLAACNNNEEAGEKKVTRDTTLILSPDAPPAPLPDKQVAADREPLPVSTAELTAAEAADDSVFADGSVPVSWANAGIDRPLDLKRFIKRLKDWVANDQRDSVAAVLAYPLTNPPVRNRQVFLSAYDKYISRSVKEALRRQPLNQIFRNSRGAMIGDGHLWLAETATGYEIIAINP